MTLVLARHTVMQDNMVERKIVVGVVGSNGRMGQEILSVLASKCIKTLTCDNGDSKSELFDKADIVIDFSSAEGLKECLKEAVRTKKPLVSGSTPMSDELRNEIEKASKETRIFWSSNTSIGVAICKKAVAMLANELADYDCELVEIHHNKKKDAPSGTARTLAETVAKARGLSNDVICYENNHERKKDQICISSVRGGCVFGEHEIMFLGQNDSITIKHTAYNRRLFATGAVECALKLINKTENGFYTIEDLFNL